MLPRFDMPNKGRRHEVTIGINIKQTKTILILYFIYHIHIPFTKDSTKDYNMNQCIQSNCLKVTIEVGAKCETCAVRSFSCEKLNFAFVKQFVHVI